MAKIDPWSIRLATECYAAVSEGGYGFICGRLAGWKLYDLKNPELCKTLSQRPGEILAAFETREELEQYLADLRKAPEQDAEEIKLNTIGSGDNKLIISQIL